MRDSILITVGFLASVIASSGCAPAIGGGQRALQCSAELRPGAVDLADPEAWVTAAIEPMEGSRFDIRRVDLATVTLAGSVPADSAFVMLADSDGDRVEDLVLRFDGRLLNAVLKPGVNRLEMTGQLRSGAAFRGVGTLTALGQAKVFRLRLLSRSGTLPARFMVQNPDRGAHEVRIHNARGALVKRWTVPASGVDRMSWDGRRETGGRASSGVYFARVASGDNLGALKIVILR